MLSLVLIKVPALLFLIVLESLMVNFWECTGQFTPSYQVDASFSPILSHVTELSILVMDRNVFPTSHKSTHFAILNSLQSFKVGFWKSTGQFTPSYQVDASFSPILSHVTELSILVMDRNVFPTSHKSTHFAILNSLQSFKVGFWKSTGQFTPSYQVEASF